MPTWAQSAAADDIAQLQKEMYQLYNKNDETAFVDITNKLKEAAQKANDERTFYKAWSNRHFTLPTISSATRDSSSPRICSSMP